MAPDSKPSLSESNEDPQGSVWEACLLETGEEAIAPSGGSGQDGFLAIEVAGCFFCDVGGLCNLGAMVAGGREKSTGPQGETKETKLSVELLQ